jgi:asparagine synthase (glutamine-hydrolysing)
MCGINGFSWQDEKLIKKMNYSIRHRGPDSEGIYLNEKVSLGHVRLSILDLSPLGNQPMFYLRKDQKKSQICIIYNGEVYNFREIREDLMKKGYLFKSETDTEVIAASYLEWGTECVKKFEGMWAFCIYDFRKEVLFLSRDRLGVKPLYYHLNKEGIIFSSEIKGLIQYKIPLKPNKQMVFDYIYYNFRNHSEKTFFKGIFRLLPGHNLIFNLRSKNLKIKKYYDLEQDLNNRRVCGFKGNFLETVRKMTISDVPIGVCLSGGLDSSSIACSIKHLFPDYKLSCFSLVFPGEKFDETTYQKCVMKKCGAAAYHNVSFSEKELIKDLEDFVYTHEEPISSTSFYGQYRLYKMIKDRNMKVVLEGQGADEILGGYEWFFAYYFKDLLLNLQIVSFFKEICSYLKNYKSLTPIKILISTLLPLKFSEVIWRYRKRYVNLKFFKKESEINIKRLHWNAGSVREMSIISEKYTQIPRLLDHGDKNSMRWSVESRVPFCDHDIVNCLINLPDKSKFKEGLTKNILRESMEGILPKEIIERKTKEGFSTPEGEILKRDLIKKDFYRLLNSNIIKKYPYIKEDEIKKMYGEHCLNKKNNESELMKIYLLYKWLEKFIEK